jgi:hypothetical protein
MWKCSGCGEEQEDQFDSCWRCGKVSGENQDPIAGQAGQSFALPVPRDPTIDKENTPTERFRRIPFFVCWRRGWLVLLLWALVGFFLTGILKAFSILVDLSLDTPYSLSWLPGLVLLVGSVLVVPAIAYWLLVIIFGEPWPYDSSKPESTPAAAAFALLQEASRLEAKGDTDAALARYQDVADKFPGTIAARNALNSIDSLQALRS